LYCTAPGSGFDFAGIQAIQTESTVILFFIAINNIFNARLELLSGWPVKLKLGYAITPIAFRASYIDNADLDNGGFLDIYL